MMSICSVILLRPLAALSYGAKLRVTFLQIKLKKKISSLRGQKKRVINIYVAAQ